LLDSLLQEIHSLKSELEGRRCEKDERKSCTEAQLCL